MTFPKLINSRFFLTAIIAFSLAGIFFSCQKELSGDGIAAGSSVTDLTTKQTSSVSGFVTDENDEAVTGASVLFGSTSATTDKFGYFEIRNVQVIQNAAVVTVLKPGYFKAVKTYIAKTGKSGFFRIKLLPKNTVGNINAAAGGSVTLINGLIIHLPAGELINAATNSTYNGTVNIAAQWADPLAADIGRIIPGDARELDSAGLMKSLSSFGIAVIELTGSNGELLQVAPGKKIAIEFTIPAAFVSIAPATIPLWHFDETWGLWKQQGFAVKTGNYYAGQINHLSSWNSIATVTDFVQFSFTVTNENGLPIPNVNVVIKDLNHPGVAANGYTDSSGFINTVIPSNSLLSIEVYSHYECNSIVYSKQIATQVADLPEATIKIPSGTTAVIKGSMVSCSNTAVKKGFVIIKNGYLNYRANLTADGSFSFNTIICGGNSTSVQITAVGNSVLQQRPPFLLTVVHGNNAVGVINSCGNTAEEYIDYTVDGTNYSISSPAASFIQNLTLASEQIFGRDNSDSTQNVNFFFSDQGIGLNSSQQLLAFYAWGLKDSSGGVSITSGIYITITEFGTEGEFIAGNFTGTLTGLPPASKPYNVTCNFRVRRRW